MSKNEFDWNVAPNLYIGDDCKKRFVLGISCENPLICFGVNPSTANQNYADKTLHNVECFAKKNSYDGWIMLNIYPQRSTDPCGLDKAKNNQLHNDNLLQVEKIIKESKGDLWAAWGNLIEKRPYLVECLKDIIEITNNYSRKWIALGQTSKGHPYHPSRRSFSEKFKAYNINHYLD